jgi:hypothetical protein
MFGFQIVDTSKNVIVPRAEFPAFEKAHKLARVLSHNDIEEILAGKKHIHGNPRRKALRAEYPKAGE